MHRIDDTSTTPRPKSVSLVRTILTDPAHLLSVVRLPLAALIWWRPAEPVFLIAILVVAAITDVLDGLVGRRLHPPAAGTANIGAWLDPVCDKAFMVSAAAAIAVSFHVAPAMIALLLMRDLAMPPLTLLFRLVGGPGLFHGHDFRARWSGKLTTGAQVFTLGAVVVAPTASWPMAIVTAVLGIVAVGERVWLAWRDHRAASP
jgi:phosphatidylglycerophosphate synthase